MGFNIKPNLERFVPHPLAKGWGILDLTTGALKQKNGYRHRLERYGCKSWADVRCKELNKKEKEKCKDQ